MARIGTSIDPAATSGREAMVLDAARRLAPSGPVLISDLARVLGWSRPAARWAVECLRNRGAWPFLGQRGATPPPDVPPMKRMHLIGRSRVVRRLAMRATRDPKPAKRPTTRARSGPTASAVAAYLEEWKRIRRDAC